VGVYLRTYTHPPALPNDLNGGTPESWTSFTSSIEFDFAHYHFVEAQSSAGLINMALDLWAATVVEFGGAAPLRNPKELYATIDAVKLSELPWKTYTVRYQGPPSSSGHSPKVDDAGVYALHTGLTSSPSFLPTLYDCLGCSSDPFVINADIIKSIQASPLTGLSLWYVNIFLFIPQLTGIYTGKRSPQ
jgi:hypothetical protein